ncbi:MAG: hypothetical protein C0596_18945 [Marinilabiliales bacterium]|nr:MAG: hypothetical protein C0596_18945 [Marinilabiliales bacterium]
MRVKSVFLIIAFIVFAMFLRAQTYMEFVDVKDMGESKTVYFQIQGLDEDESARNELLNDLLADPDVYRGRIFTSSSYKTRCQLYLPHNIGPEHIRPILQSHGYDFEFSSVTFDGKLLVQKSEKTFVSMFYPPVEDFPAYKNTGDKDKDDAEYRESKEAWINANPKKYTKSKSQGTAELPIIITQEQFYSFTEEKKQKILEQPEVFEIR